MSQSIEALQQHIMALEAKIAEQQEQLKQDKVVQQLYEQIFASSPDLISVLDRNYTYRLVNETYLKVHGKERQHIVNHTAMDLMGQEKFETLLKPNLDRCLAGEIIYYQAWFEFGGVGKQFVNVIYFPYYTPQQTIDGVVVQVQLITEQEEMRAKLSQSELRMRLAIESTNTGLWDWDMSSNNVYFSPRYFAIIEYGPEELPHNFDTWRSLLHPDDLPHAEAALGDYLMGKTPHFSVEFRMKTKTGAWRWILSRGDIVERDAENNPIRMIGTHVDIDDRKRIETEQQQLQQEIIQAQTLAIQELSTPIIPLMDGIIVMPLVGSIDSLRARDIMRTLLKGVSDHRAKVVILDITGVGLIDTRIVGHLDKTIQAARLKGARTIVTGMSDVVAETIVDLGINWSGVETLRDLQTGLGVALRSLGIQLTL